MHIARNKTEWYHSTNQIKSNMTLQAVLHFMPDPNNMCPLLCP